jgi:1,4-alpha-glucan branching enzyme
MSSEPDGLTKADASASEVMVTFRLPETVDAERVCVVGEFNGWSETADPMQHDGDAFVAQIPLEVGRAYRFRYLLDGERWENDWAADAYVPNEFGGEDSVIDLTDAATAPAAVPIAPSADARPEPPAKPKATRAKARAAVKKGA